MWDPSVEILYIHIFLILTANYGAEAKKINQKPQFW